MLYIWCHWFLGNVSDGDFGSRGASEFTVSDDSIFSVSLEQNGRKIRIEISPYTEPGESPLAYSVGLRLFSVGLERV